MKAILSSPLTKQMKCYILLFKLVNIEVCLKVYIYIYIVNLKH